MARRDGPTRKTRPGENVDVAVSAGAARALLLHRRGRPTGVLHLDAMTPYTIGRGAAADVFFDDDAVSRVHAHLKHEDGAWVLVDARSANGTFAGAADFAHATRVLPGEPRALGVGDVVFLGDAHASIEVVAATRATNVVDGANDVEAFGERGTRYVRDLEKAARARGPVLLVGASGAGKTWAAKRIHDRSARKGAFVALNGAALPRDPTQLRSALLGHKRGAFTGAAADFEGAFYAARDGTLFLDEVDSLEPAAQAFLLTLIEQSGDLAPLGAPATTRAPIDVRFVTASKVALRDAGLRSDLAFRLVDGTIVEIPSLAERREDIPRLVAQLCDELRREDGAVAAFDEAALERCARAEWPGEVRQLRGVVRLLAREAAEEGRARVSAADVDARLAALARALGATATSSTAKKPRELTRDDVENALAAVGGNIERAAARLGIARRTLMKKMDDFGVARPGRR